jgi:photosystem II stability/assembly factor-like uncharacterized protein
MHKQKMSATMSRKPNLGAIKILLLIPLLFLGVSCNPLAKSGSGGLAKSTNGGVDWILANKQNGGSGSMQAANISKLDFDPKNHETVYAGTYNAGMFKSSDSGGAWTNILSKITVFDFAVHPYSSSTIYAAGDYGGFGKVLKTEDGGKSWLQKYNEAGANTPVRGIALSPFDPNQIIIGTESGSVIKSADGGNNWQLLKDFKGIIAHVYWTNSGVYVLLRQKGLYKGGGNFDDFTELTNPLVQQSLLDQFNNRQSVGLFYQAYIDPVSPSLVYITTDRGLFKTTDAGKTWNFVKLPVKQQNLNPRPIVVSKQNSNTVLTAVGTTVYKSTDGGNSFQTQNVPFSNAFVNTLLIDPVLPQVMYTGGYVDTSQ